MRPALNHTTNVNPRRPLPPDVGKAVAGVTEQELEHSCHFLSTVFHTPPKIPDYIIRLPRRPEFSYLFLSSTHFLDISYSLHFRVPIPFIIVINSVYTLTLASGIRYF